MRKYLLLAAILIIANFNYSQQEYKGLFWKVYGNNLSDTSYLYGTMHTQDERVFQFKDGVLDAFNKSIVYAMELNMDSVNEFEVIQQLIMDSTYSLQTLLTKKEYTFVDQYFKDSLNISLFLFNKMYPIFTSQMIALKDLGNEKEEALDLYFFTEAKKQQKIIVGLEKMEDQINTFKSIPYELQAKELLRAVQDIYNGNALQIDELMEWYIKGDLNKLLELTSENESSSNEMNEIINTVFLIDRNHKMADRSEKYIKKGPTFIAVGAAHLPGEEGIIENLRSKGYTVKAP
jgi:uncharacterized protein YbaP (TraB family)